MAVLTSAALASCPKKVWSKFARPQIAAPVLTVCAHTLTAETLTRKQSVWAGLCFLTQATPLGLPLA